MMLVSYVSFKRSNIGQEFLEYLGTFEACLAFDDAYWVVFSLYQDITQEQKPEKTMRKKKLCFPVSFL